MDKFITMDGASFTLAHVLSFRNQNDFVNEHVKGFYTWLPLPKAKVKLKEVYKIAKTLE
jgi:hypothetical protein